MTIAQKFPVADLVEAHIRAHSARSMPISIAGAIRAVRLSAPHCEMTDCELTNVIVRIAIMNGRSIFFDRGEEESEKLPPIR
ncbi:hypothetical protein L598_000600000940 [Mesorhizobium sp. J18]|uniref:hypothetical protein n=1 Tax=Mesorhizobium sp. J18 TaxID=935263 RepID=UPI00119C7BE1|nr:hypothetical protein [Mesorhizobium sp. J18]TWG91354.1 hypothetical protein L598_000600000940 [Mesorhizobium sp. J18]